MWTFLKNIWLFGGAPQHLTPILANGHKLNVLDT